MSALSRVFYRGTLSAGLAFTALTGFAALPAEAAVAAALPVADDQQGGAPFAEMQSRIAEIESRIETLQRRTPQEPPAETALRTPDSTGTGAQAGELRLPGQAALDEVQAQLEGGGLRLPELQSGDLRLPEPLQPGGARAQAGGLPLPEAAPQDARTQAAGGTAAARVRQVVTTALGKVGEGERKDGTTFYGAWYDDYTDQKGFAGAAWCDMFLSWVAVQHGLEKQMGVFAYTPWHAEWFKKQGRFDRKPQAGDLVFFDWAGSRSISAIDHIGLVTGVNPDGSVSTVEGNISDKVVTRTRTMDTIVGFGHPAYGG
ncbi:CHAP domain-containing protein [Planomonospora sp. ID91781]|uniref:CHAP domain-containing protein n=1 Tax=Planomonospora sp. ID91781 TaxID=2738135 RepID=UPI0018C433F0|nr:CHAP domain-containing protein [Planomonospora sp. ID91781]MBG0822782.1 CHAP domain-containing protein [Planomonospora sp. ID91781]